MVFSYIAQLWSFSVFLTVASASDTGFCGNSPRAEVFISECELTSVLSCEIFIGVYALASLVLLTLLILSCLIHRRHQVRVGNEQQMTASQEESMGYASEVDKTILTGTDRANNGTTVVSNKALSSQFNLSRLTLMKNTEADGGSSSSSEEDVNGDMKMIGVSEEQLYGLSSVWTGAPYQEKGFFRGVLILILACLLSRLLYLFIIYVEGTKHKYQYGIWTNLWSTVFKNLTILFICKFKLHSEYMLKRQKVQNWIRWTLFTLEVLAVLIPIGLSVANCTQMGTQAYKILLQFVNIVTSILLMSLSAYLACKLIQKMTFGTTMDLRKSICMMEFVIQVMLLGRCVIFGLVVSRLSETEDIDTDNPAILTAFIAYLLLTELLPFAYLVYSMVQRLKSKKQANNLDLEQSSKEGSRGVSSTTLSSSQQLGDMSNLNEDELLLLRGQNSFLQSSSQARQSRSIVGMMQKNNSSLLVQDNQSRAASVSATGKKKSKRKAIVAQSSSNTQIQDMLRVKSAQRSASPSVSEFRSENFYSGTWGPKPDQRIEVSREDTIAQCHLTSSRVFDQSLSDQLQSDSHNSQERRFLSQNMHQRVESDKYEGDSSQRNESHQQDYIDVEETQFRHIRKRSDNDFGTSESDQAVSDGRSFKLKRNLSRVVKQVSSFVSKRRGLNDLNSQSNNLIESKAQTDSMNGSEPELFQDELNSKFRETHSSINFQQDH